MQIRATRPNLNAQAGKIVDQSPRAGEMVPVNYSVSVVVGSAPEENDASLMK